LNVVIFLGFGFFFLEKMAFLLFFGPQSHMIWGSPVLITSTFHHRWGYFSSLRHFFSLGVRFFVVCGWRLCGVFLLFFFLFFFFLVVGVFFFLFLFVLLGNSGFFSLFDDLTGGPPFLSFLPLHLLLVVLSLFEPPVFSSFMPLLPPSLFLLFLLSHLVPPPPPAAVTKYRVG